LKLFSRGNRSRRRVFRGSAVVHLGPTGFPGAECRLKLLECGRRGNCPRSPNFGPLFTPRGRGRGILSSVSGNRSRRRVKLGSPSGHRVAHFWATGWPEFHPSPAAVSGHVAHFGTTFRQRRIRDFRWPTFGPQGCPARGAVGSCFHAAAEGIFRSGLLVAHFGPT
jgi:hypothetical protein